MTTTPDFTGMTMPTPTELVARCPNACSADRCVISTVAVCKHPAKSGDQGCGPITLANRHEALKALGITILSNGEIIRPGEAL
jgi:hypothetical protein